MFLQIFFPQTDISAKIHENVREVMSNYASIKNPHKARLFDIVL
jgi:hypothetical protein